MQELRQISKKLDRKFNCFSGRTRNYVRGGAYFIRPRFSNFGVFAASDTDTSNCPCRTIEIQPYFDQKCLLAM
jgi:hypothetical protein